MSVEDAEGQWTPARDIEFETLPEGPTTPILLGKPWKTQMGVIQFYKLDVVFTPNFSQPSYLRQWTKLVSIGSCHPLPCTPDTPLDAICLLTAAQPYVSTVADLKSQELPLADVSTVNLEQVDHSIEDVEIEDQVVQWTLSMGKYVQLPKKVWLEQPIKQDRLETLQHLLPVEVNDPKYQALEIQFGEQGMLEECQHLQALLKAEHLTFAETTSNCKQNHVVICDPQLIKEPPNTVQRSKTQALSPPQKEFLHQQVRKLIDNGFLIKVPGDQVWWISETCIVPKPAAEIESNISIEELQCQVNASLKAAGLEHNPSMSDPAPLPIKLSEA
ncbi:uncharacterized protein UBRO2_03808 [Ustilago bromivora]|uniref:Uncharacterized protein n=1 Tax=Ustilago bromivora TaxID=307758 RepID=A0A8H8TRP9_9BASI|nr:uncharacterized protein UBRO2_03808 [Ustilago bromivora]